MSNKHVPSYIDRRKKKKRFLTVHADTVELDDIIYDHKWAPDDALGLDHIDRRPNKANIEKGIVMR